MNTFSEKVVVITAAGSGIGRSLAQQLAVNGARLALPDVNLQGLAETLMSLRANTDARAYALNVSNRDAVLAHVDEIKRDFCASHHRWAGTRRLLSGTTSNLQLETAS